MSRLLFTSSAVATAVFAPAIFAPSAYAADLTCDCAAPLPLPPAVGGPTVLNPWAGPYIGVTVAFIDNRIHQGENGPGQWPTSYGQSYRDSYTGQSGRIGLHAGINEQRGAFVYGVEADFGRQLSSERHIGQHPGVDSFRPLWDASVRARVGVADGNMLYYGTGGLSIANVNLRLDDVTAGTNVHTGWTIGAGAEVMLTDQLSGRLETRYTDYGAQNYQSIHGPIRMGFEDERVVVGLSYRF